MSNPDELTGDKPFGTMHSIIREQRERDKAFADKVKSDKPSLNDKMFHEHLDRQQEIMLTEIDRRVKEIAASMTSESIVETLEASVNSCREQAEVITMQDEVIQALWGCAKGNATGRRLDHILRDSRTLDEFKKKILEVKDDT